MMTKSPNPPPHLLQAVQDTLNAYLEKARRHCNTPFLEPSIIYRLRGTRAGTAHLLSWEIRLNPILLIENQERFINTVVPHELAHLLVFQQFGLVKPHGKEWRWMMSTVLGVSAERTHSFNLQSVKGRCVDYHCQCQIHQLSIRRHNKIMRNQSQYYCRHCKQQLQVNPFLGLTCN